MLSASWIGLVREDDVHGFQGKEEEKVDNKKKTEQVHRILIRLNERVQGVDIDMAFHPRVVYVACCSQRLDACILQ